MERKGTGERASEIGSAPDVRLDNEEPTDVGPTITATLRCVPCRGTGELVAQFFPAAISRRPCVACGGTGRRRLAQPADEHRRSG